MKEALRLKFFTKRVSSINPGGQETCIYSGHRCRQNHNAHGSHQDRTCEMHIAGDDREVGQMSSRKKKEKCTEGLFTFRNPNGDCRQFIAKPRKNSYSDGRWVCMNHTAAVMLVAKTM